MTQEKKQLLFTDLCTRLPYEVKGLHRGKVHELFTIDGRETNNACIQVDGYNAWFPIETFMPYLRSMSSMTDEEFKEYHSMLIDVDNSGLMNQGLITKIVDWLDRKMFDHRNLVLKSLALEAPEGMYKTE